MDDRPDRRRFLLEERVNATDSVFQNDTTNCVDFFWMQCNNICRFVLSGDRRHNLFYRDGDAMVLEKIKQCLDMMKEYDLREFHIKFDEFELRASRGDQSPVVVHQGAHLAPIAARPAPAADAPAAPAPASAAATGSVEITSPIVGTFYRRSSPDSPLLVDTDDIVDADTVVCLVEAMKVFNEIKAKVSGVIVKCLVKDGDPVEYGQPLFLVRPSA